MSERPERREPISASPEYGRVISPTQESQKP